MQHITRRAGAAGTIVGQPLDIVRVRLQAQGARVSVATFAAETAAAVKSASPAAAVHVGGSGGVHYRGAIDCLRHIIKYEGERTSSALRARRLAS